MKTEEYLERIATDATYRRQRLEEMRYLTKVIGWLAILTIPIALLDSLDTWSATSDLVSALARAFVSAGFPLLIYERFRYQVRVLDAFESRPNQAPEPTIMTVTPRAPSSTSRASHDRGSA